MKEDQETGDVGFFDRHFPTLYSDISSCPGFTVAPITALYGAYSVMATLTSYQSDFGFTPSPTTSSTTPSSSSAIASRTPSTTSVQETSTTSISSAAASTSPATTHSPAKETVVSNSDTAVIQPSMSPGPSSSSADQDYSSLVDIVFSAASASESGAGVSSQEASGTQSYANTDSTSESGRPPTLTSASEASSYPHTASYSPSSARPSQSSTSKTYGIAASPAAHSVTALGVTTSSQEAPSITIGSEVIPLSYASSSAGLVLPNRETLAPGSATIYSGVTISLPSANSANEVLIGTKAVTLPAPESLTIGSEAVPVSYASNSAGLVLPNGNTLSPGSAITYNGVTISLLPSQTYPAIVVGTSTVTPPTPLTIGSEAIPISYAPSSADLILPNGHTLRPGSATTYNGITISLASSAANEVIIGSSTVNLPAIAVSATALPSATAPPSLLGHPISYAPSSAGIVLPNGETLAPGSATTISGTAVFLAKGETAVVVGSSTVALPPPSGTTLGSHGTSGMQSATRAPAGSGSGGSQTTGGLGDYIASGIGGVASSSGNASSSVPLQQTTNGAMGVWEEGCEKVWWLLSLAAIYSMICMCM